MDQKKVLISISILFCCCFIGSKCSDGFVHFKSLKCVGSEKFVHSNLTCFAKSYSRNLSTINFQIIFKMPINELIVSCAILSTHLEILKSSFLCTKIESTLLFKYGTIYRQVMTIPKLDYCQYIKVTAKENMLMYQLVRIIKAADPTIVHDCPYTVK